MTTMKEAGENLLSHMQTEKIALTLQEKIDAGLPIKEQEFQDRAAATRHIAETTATPELTEEPIIAQPSASDVQAAWERLEAENPPWFARSQNPEPLVMPPHQHVFMFSLNANHTALRGCIHCGQTDASLVMGDEHNLIWHRIQEGGESA